MTKYVKLLVVINVISVIIAGVLAAALLSSGASNKAGTVGEAETNTITVVVSTRDIPAETQIDETMIVAKQIPQKYVIDKNVSSPQDIIGKTANHAINRNEQLTLNSVSE